MTGTADADHPRKLDESIVKWLNQNGAKADFIYLGDGGIYSAIAPSWRLRCLAVSRRRRSFASFRR
jgi:hypothetical protein